MLYRQLHKEQILISDKNLRFSNYQFSFVNAVKPRQLVSVEIKESQLKEGENTTLSNRIGVKADGVLVLLGYKKESKEALFLPAPDLPGVVLY